MTHDEVDDDAVQQIAAGIALIRASSLMIFDDKSKTFIPTDMQSFERTAADVHPRFGRVMKWIWLSTGAEYLLKGALISNRDFVPSAGTAEKLDLPAADELDKFIDEVFTIARKSPAKDYKTLSAMQEGLKKLCSRHRDEVRRAKSLRAAFTLLGGISSKSRRSRVRAGPAHRALSSTEPVRSRVRHPSCLGATRLGRTSGGEGA